MFNHLSSCSCRPKESPWHRQNGQNIDRMVFFSCQDKFLKSQLLGCKSSMSLTFKIYTDLLRTSIRTVIFPQVAGFTRNSRASAPFSTKSSVLARFGQDKNESRFVLCVFRLAFKIHSLRLRTVVTSMAALVNCTSNFRKTEVPSIATGSHLHFKKHNKTRQNFKTSEEREHNPSNRVSPFRLKVPLCLQKNHAQGSALSISSCAISCEVHARSEYISYLFP